MDRSANPIGHVIRRRRLRLPGVPAAKVERRIVIEDGPLEVLQFPTRLNPELAVEDLASLVIDVERVRLAPRAIEREHQASRERLAQRHLSDDPAQLGHDFEMVAAGQLSIDSPLEYERTKLVEPRPLSSGGIARGEIPERRASPQTEGGSQGRGRGLRLAAFEGTRRVGRRGTRTARRRPRSLLTEADSRWAVSRSSPGPGPAGGPPRAPRARAVHRAADRRLQISSISRSPVTVLPTFNTRSARTARGRGPPILIGPRGPTTSSGPRMRNSMAAKSSHREQTVSKQ